MIKYAVFDWDGTLADTYPVITGAYDYAFRKMNIPAISVEEVKKVTSSKQNKDIFSFLFHEHASKARQAYYTYIEKYHTKNLKAIDGAKELLDFCLQNNITSLLITNKKTKYIMEELKVLGFEKYFSKVVAAGEYAQDKPHQTACHALFDGHLPLSSEVVVIGDGKADLEVAKCYGACSIIYQNKVKGDYNITRLTQAIDIIKGK
ncbi:MAG: HAD family hydrolase [Alphaproteobacteria bacterium]|nr:HAD family hydrolase [Alphaproteobacteria bacterium]